MPGAEVLLESLGHDPVLVYTLLAALFLASVSLVTGLLRLDFLALLQPSVLLQLSAAVLVAVVFTIWGNLLGDIAPWSAGDDPIAPLRIQVLGRFPLYLMALAYGPLPGLAAAGLMAAFEAGTQTSPWTVPILALELLVIGWLAIYPSPRQTRWAGPLDAGLGYLLVWSTAGLALLQHQEGRVTLASLWQQQQAVLPSLLLCLALLSLIGPRLYRDAFRWSRIDPRPRITDPRPASFSAQSAPQAQRDRARLTDPGFPLSLRRQRGQRELEPLPPLDD